MLPYDTHDKAEGIIQEYSCHVLPIIKYLEITERKLSSLSGRIFCKTKPCTKWDQTHSSYASQDIFFEMLFIREEDQWLTLSSVCGSDGCHRSLAEILSSLAAYLLEKK